MPKRAVPQSGNGPIQQNYARISACLMPAGAYACQSLRLLDWSRSRFGGSSLRRSRRCRLWLGLVLILILVLLRRGDDGVQNRTFHARHELDGARFANVLNQPVDLG